MNITNKNLCIIPARGGSKRIPRKNIKDFLGKPIIAYSIETAIESKLFDEVMVSTDDQEIAKISEKYGAKFPFFRSEENSNDFATTFKVIEEVIENYKSKGLSFDKICCIYPCAPFVSAEKLRNAYEILIENNFDSVFPIMEFSFPIQRSLKLSQNKLGFFYPEFANTRSQDLEKSYHDAGQFYFMDSQKVLEQKTILTNNSGAIVISALEGQDIDSETDWKLAELKYKLLQNDIS